MKVIPFTVFPFKPIVLYNEHERKTSDAESGICFSRAIRERAACEAGGRARQRGLVIEGEKREHERKTSDAESGICFSRAIRERAACEAGGRARQRGLVIEGEKRERGQPGCSSQRAKPVADNRFILTCWFDLVISFIILMFLVQFYTRFQACTQFFTRR